MAIGKGNRRARGKFKGQLTPLGYRARMKAGKVKWSKVRLYYDPRRKKETENRATGKTVA